MREEDIHRIEARLNQLMSRSIAQDTMAKILLGLFAKSATDWRDLIDNLRMMGEWTIKNLEWEGEHSEAEGIRSAALAHFQEGLDGLYEALARSERGEPPPAE